MAIELNIEKIKKLIYKKGTDIPTFYKKQGWSRFTWHYLLKRKATARNIDMIAKALGVKDKEIIK
jgi:lambda repressor-like predicted transcriptional regulator